MDKKILHSVTRSLADLCPKVSLLAAFAKIGYQLSQFMLPSSQLMAKLRQLMQVEIELGTVADEFCTANQAQTSATAA